MTSSYLFVRKSWESLVHNLKKGWQKGSMYVGKAILEPGTACNERQGTYLASGVRQKVSYTSGIERVVPWTRCKLLAVFVDYIMVT